MVLPIATRLALIGAKKGAEFVIKKFGVKTAKKYGKQIPRIAKERNVEAATLRANRRIARYNKLKKSKQIDTTTDTAGGVKTKKVRPPQLRVKDAVTGKKPDRKSLFGKAGYNFPNYNKGGVVKNKKK